MNTNIPLLTEFLRNCTTQQEHQQQQQQHRQALAAAAAAAANRVAPAAAAANIEEPVAAATAARAAAEAVVNFEKPLYCREQLCIVCPVKPLYSMDSLVNNKNRPSQTNINKELILHNHPGSRAMPNGKKRVTAEAALELAKHYQFSHGKAWPEN